MKRILNEDRRIAEKVYVGVIIFEGRNDIRKMNDIEKIEKKFYKKG